MSETPSPIPDREKFRSADVCEIAQVQPYVLKSWEQEFANLGTTRVPGGARIYRRGDVERVLQIKQLVFGEGLTLAGVRRRLEGEPAVEAPPDDAADLFDETKRARLIEIRRELRSLLDMLEGTQATVDAGAVAVDPAGQTRPKRPARKKAKATADEA